MYKSVFISGVIIDTVGQITLCCWFHPVHSEVFSSVPSFYPLQSCGTSPVRSAKTPDIVKLLLGSKLTPVENTGLKEFSSSGTCVKYVLSM